MNRTELEGVINVAWENRDEISSATPVSYTHLTLPTTPYV